MYMPKHFEETRIDVLHALIRDHPLGMLVTMTAGGLVANHVPFEIVEQGPLGVLRCHVARANPVWKETSKDVDALVVFGGPDAYISPAWYPTKRESGKVVPTWNYVVVHAYGRPAIVEDRDWLLGLVSRLTARHERDRPDPWQVSDAPADFVDQMLRMIVGIEIPIARIAGKWKVSQNRSERERAGAAEGLVREHGDVAAVMAELVRSAPRGG